MTVNAPTASIADLLRDAQAHLTASRFAEALGVLLKASDLAPDDDRVWTDLILAYQGQGEHEYAIRAGLKAIELMPVNHEAWQRLADVFAIVGAWEDALAAAQRQFELAPYLPDGLYKAAVAHVKLDDTQGALRALEAALSQQRSLRDRLLTDPAFDPIRELPGFRLLID